MIRRNTARDDCVVHQTRVGVGAGMRVHARRCVEARRIRQRAFLHRQPALAQLDADLVEPLSRQLVPDWRAATLAFQRNPANESCYRYVAAVKRSLARFADNHIRFASL